MPLPEGFTLRRATTADLDTLVEHRRAMFQDMGYIDHAAMSSMSTKFRPWLLAHMNAGDYLAWLISAPEGAIAAGTGLWLMDWPPHMVGKGARRGNILNVYTHADFRRRGLARELMRAALAWCGENGVDTVILHASDSGRTLYESMGFTPTNEMRLRL
jgi:GNAT superfamily N-acetyltransferase